MKSVPGAYSNVFWKNARSQTAPTTEFPQAYPFTNSFGPVYCFGAVIVKVGSKPRSSIQAIKEGCMLRQRWGSVVCPSCGTLVGVLDERCLTCGRWNPGMWGFGPFLTRLGR